MFKHVLTLLYFFTFKNDLIINLQTKIIIFNL